MSSVSGRASSTTFGMSIFSGSTEGCSVTVFSTTGCCSGRYSPLSTSSITLCDFGSLMGRVT
ncbi:MAG: hypothetical protein K5842_05250 [Bacteroidales bacterium]|nr:hypothetical protein [Bacteroidales bacterium]